VAQNDTRMPSYLVHFGYLLMLAGLVARDILVLRCLLLGAQIILAFYAVSIAVPAITAWNVVFATINVVWIGLIVRERRATQVPVEWQSIHERHFSAMSPAEFLRWWRLGRTETIHTRPLTREGVTPSSLYFVLAGAAKVQRGETELSQLGPGSFVGEMSLVTGRAANADVEPLGEVTVRQWDRTDVEPLQSRDLTMWTKIQSAIGVDLVAKIRRGDERLVEDSGR
jgi:CRP-like cAMP-binding protein